MAAIGVPGASAASTNVGPYEIDGGIGTGALLPDAEASEVTDPYGNVKELGPINSNTTKIGVIHNDQPPTLNATNPNGQVDLRRAWLDLQRVGNQDYVYFAWERDANSGSGFIAFEFMLNAAPAACVYSPPLTEASLATCNPFANRSAGDFLILWDQQGGSKALTYREWTDADNDGILTLDAGVPLVAGANAAAEYSSDGFRGEAAVNLTHFGLTPGTGCTTLANTVPSTVTGNSDTADYKDTILTRLSLSNCGTITINKVAQNGNGTFAYTTTGGLAGGAFNLTTTTGTTGNTASSTFSDVYAGSYTVTEAAQTAPWSFVSLACSSTGTGTSVSPTSSTSSREATITLAGNGAVTCTYTNRMSFSPTIATSINGNATTSVQVGGSVYDTAALTGASSDASGTVTYRVYTDVTCTTLAVAGTDIDAQPSAVTVTNGVIPSSGNVQFLRAGSYQFQASYSGDSKNVGPVSSTCGSEPLTVTKAPPSVTTAQKFLPNDSLTLSGGVSPTGTVTFKLFGPDNTTCSTAAGAAGPVYSQTLTVSGNGTYSTSNTATEVTTPGTYRWLSTYSGDGNNDPATSACGVEQFSFTNTSS